MGEDKSAEVLGNVVGIVVLDAGGLPTEKMPLRVCAEPFNSVQIHAPLHAVVHELATNRGQRNSCSGVPDFPIFIDACPRLPPGSPVMVIAFMIQVYRQVDPISCRCNLELAITADVC